MTFGFVSELGSLHPFTESIKSHDLIMAVKRRHRLAQSIIFAFRFSIFIESVTCFAMTLWIDKAIC
jgi:hypothetical protein